MNVKNDILFSIIIPTYNRASFISNAIQSVIDQDFQNWELIIVDDGSSDDTENVCRRYTDKRIKYYFQNNQGRSSARNYGIKMSNGKYLSFLDDDDLYYPDFLSEMYNHLSTKGFPKAIFMCQQDEKLENGIIIKPLKKDFFAENQAKFILKYANNFQSFCTSKEILNSITFDERFELGEDFHILLRIVLQFPLYYIPKTLCIYQFHKEMTMKNEFENVLTSRYKYNRLDALEDIINNYPLHIKRYKIGDLLLKRHNKIAYFYSSFALKKCKLKESYDYQKKIYFKPLNFSTIYYKLSMFLRLFFYFFMCKISSTNK